MRENDAPRVSVIIPIYNCEAYLSGCLDSIANQTYGDLEVVLVNDGSTDGSRRIAEAYAQKHGWVLIDQENQGSNKARHTGFAASTGSLVMFVDSDDMIVWQTVSISVEQMARSKTDMAVFPLRLFTGNIAPEELAQVGSYGTRVIKEPLEWHFRTSGFVSNLFTMTACGKLYKRELLDDIDWDLIDFRLNEDEAFVCYPYKNAKNGIVLVKAELYLYHEHQDSKSTSTYQNRYQGRTLNRIQFFNELFDVQLKILGDGYYPYILNYNMFIAVTLFSDDYIKALGAEGVGMETRAAAADAARMEARGAEDAGMGAPGAPAATGIEAPGAPAATGIGAETQDFKAYMEKRCAEYLRLPVGITSNGIREAVEKYQQAGLEGFIDHCQLMQAKSEQDRIKSPGGLKARIVDLVFQSDRLLPLARSVRNLGKRLKQLIRGRG